MKITNKIVRTSGKAALCVAGYSRIPYLIGLLQSRNKPNAVFIWIPKTAGTSVWLGLGATKLRILHSAKYSFTNRGIVTFGHMDYSRLVSEGIVKSNFDDTAFKFAFARNPYARAVSLFNYLQKITKRIPTDESFLDFCRRLHTSGCPPIGLYNVLGLSQCNPQVRWTENISMDYIGKVESIDKDFESISSRLGLKTNALPHANKSYSSSYLDYYCRESKEIIQDFYKEDFIAFHYSQELPATSRCPLQNDA